MHAELIILTSNSSTMALQGQYSLDLQLVLTLVKGRTTFYPEQAYTSSPLVQPNYVEQDYTSPSEQEQSIATSILGNKMIAEVLILSIDGLTVDLPSTNVLKKRMEILIEKFQA